MALKALMLRKKIDDANKTLATLKEKRDGFATREAELETAIAEAETDEERTAVEESIEEFETEKNANADEISEVEKNIRDLEAELDEEEKRSAKITSKNKTKQEKKEMIRSKFFGMTYEERDAFFSREDVNTFLGTVKDAIENKRAISNVGLVIPTVMLDLMKQIVEKESKLYRKVTVKLVNGTARQTIMGDIPEAIWTEMCASLNEMDLGFNNVEVDGYKVGGYIAVCNAILEDNDVNLATEIITAIGIAIAKALDKAIVFGTGTKMPKGIVTRLAEATQPSGYPATARPWVKLSTTNIITGTGASGIALFKQIAKMAGVIKNKYSTDNLVWLMSKTTHMDILVESMDKNANAAIVAGMSDVMPVIGGEIIELDFIPDGQIVVGYMKNYLLAERSGAKIEQSKEHRFIQDQTVFKGTARYDGVPAIAEAFATFTIGTTAPATTVTFPTDTAN